MNSNSSNWLPHLKGVIPKSAYGYKTCIYSLALEGWRRGLELKFINNFGTGTKPPIKYALKSSDREYTFSISRANVMPKEAIRVSIDKNKTKDVLAKANVAVPEGRNFGSEATDEEITEYAKTTGFPLVLKPSDAGGGDGVFTNINDVSTFQHALNEIRHHLNYKNVMVERYVSGMDYRIYILDKKIIGAFKRLPANVIGDGETPIKELIREKNEIRKESPFLYYKPIQIDNKLTIFLAQSSFTIESIPEKGERVFLREKGEFADGGDPVDVTDDLTEEISNTAIAAANAVPGFVQCGVDMIVDEKNNSGVVNELNSKAQISNHLFPLEGMARDIPKAIIDYYFPETIEKERNDQFYFDFTAIHDAFKTGVAKEMKVPALPQNHIATRYIVSGSFQRGNYKKWVQNKAIRLNINGFVRDMDNGKVVIVAAGTSKNLQTFKKTIEHESPKEVTISNVMEKKRTSPIKIGFEIRKAKSPVNQRDVDAANKEGTQMGNKQATDERKRATETGTLLSKPVRVIGKVVKRIGKSGRS